MSRRFLLQPVICTQSAVDLEIWADFGRFEWFCEGKGNSMTEIRVYIFGKGFPQATASLAKCYNAVEGSYPPKSNNKIRKLDWHSIDVRRPLILVVGMTSCDSQTKGRHIYLGWQQQIEQRLPPQNKYGAEIIARMSDWENRRTTLKQLTYVEQGSALTWPFRGNVPPWPYTLARPFIWHLRVFGSQDSKNIGRQWRDSTSMQCRLDQEPFLAR